MIKLDNFSTKMLNKKKFHFIKKNFPKKVTSRHNMKPNTHTRQEYKDKIMLIESEKIHVGYGYGCEKNHSGSTTLHIVVFPSGIQEAAICG
jgi:hypothetical protein